MYIDSPICGNHAFKPASLDSAFVRWKEKGVECLKDLYQGDHLIPFCRDLEDIAALLLQNESVKATPTLRRPSIMALFNASGSQLVGLATVTKGGRGFAKGQLKPDPLLGSTGDTNLNYGSDKWLVFLGAVLAKKLILRFWKSDAVPTFEMWLREVGEILYLE
ncbi:hypothetical protein NQZ68_014184 [Dissostichus eleginoides]|nr:hypothetical protein NQZ68_014184 [Dissostichus eleginoides]